MGREQSGDLISQMRILPLQTGEEGRTVINTAIQS
jgi:hypothetical protein